MNKIVKKNKMGKINKTGKIMIILQKNFMLLKKIWSRKLRISIKIREVSKVNQNF